MTQRDLVDAAMRGDHDAFEALATAASGRLYAIARLILRDVHLAEDALQETLVHIWRSLPTLRDPAHFDAWSYRLLVNACADAGRERRRLSAEVRLIRPESVDPDTRGVRGRPRPDRASVPPPQAGAAGRARPPLLRRSSGARCGRRAGDPGRDSEVAHPLRDRAHARRARGRRPRIDDHGWTVRMTSRTGIEDRIALAIFVCPLLVEVTYCSKSSARPRQGAHHL